MRKILVFVLSFALINPITFTITSTKQSFVRRFNAFALALAFALQAKARARARTCTELCMQSALQEPSSYKHELQVQSSALFAVLTKPRFNAHALYKSKI